MLVSRRRGAAHQRVSILKARWRPAFCTQLRDLERSGLIARKIYPVVPPRVEYTITMKGRKAIPVIEAIRNYGLELMREAGIDPAPGRRSSSRK